MPEGGWFWVAKTSELVPDSWKASGEGGVAASLDRASLNRVFRLTAER